MSAEPTDAWTRACLRLAILRRSLHRRIDHRCLAEFKRDRVAHFVRAHDLAGALRVQNADLREREQN